MNSTKNNMKHNDSPAALERKVQKLTALYEISQDKKPGKKEQKNRKQKLRKQFDKLSGRLLQVSRGKILP
ncbi:MAG: hypothetical protein D4R73_00720 [Deltaproteobacteria bacterium]|nr:MAG: hypothetical protein D4R73_00720 [Deltaproteobacteria bacterium]